MFGFDFDFDDLRETSNCLFFAVALFARRLAKGERGYFQMRKSDYGPFPHFLYERLDPKGNKRVVSYVPNDPEPRTLPPPLFKGHVQWGDPPPKHKGLYHDESHSLELDTAEPVEVQSYPANPASKPR